VSGERILVLAPFGRDGALAEQALTGGGLPAQACADIEELCREIAAGAGAAVLAEEALFPAAAARLQALLAEQPPWSDFPLIIFGKGESSIGQAANVTLLDRPVRIRTLLSAARAALRARRRQYQVRDRDQFLAMLGHELRNPISAILTASELMDRAAGAQSLRERVVVARQVRHLSRLVDDLLDVSRVTHGKIPLRERDVDLRRLVDRAAQAFEQAAQLQRVQLACAVGADPAIVRGDPLRLEQVVGNLVSNAIKYTNAGGRVELRVEAQDGQAVLRVRDTGVGIAPAMLPRVFELFAQAPGALDRAQGGMGIGLTLVKRLVELHRGTVQAASEGPGQGSEFVVRLPLAGPAPAGSAQGAVKDGSRPSASRRLHVVIAEDNVDARDLLQFALEQLGHRVEPCEDGVSAIECAVVGKPDAMLIDLGLPGSDGYQVARAVRGALGEAIRLVALTGYGQPGDRERALAAGFDAFLVKPAEIEAVARALRASA